MSHQKQLNTLPGWVFITGAASGLGAATARELHAQGYYVFLTDVQLEPLKQLASELTERVAIAVCDVTQTPHITATLEQLQSLGTLQAVVHCAGILYAQRVMGPHGVHPLEAFQKVIDINLIGTFNVVRLAAQAMWENQPGADGQRGVLIVTSSIAAEDGQAGIAAYAASKGGISAMILTLAREFGKQGIRVMGIAPGAFETPLMARVPEEHRQALEQQIPFPHRMGQPVEFARLVQFILENRMFNGTVLRLDGALRMPAN